MKLIFIEQDKTLGEVQIVDGQMVGKPAFKQVVQSRMRRDNVDLVGALKSLHNWTNGYLTTRLVEE